MLESSIPCTGQAKLRPQNLGSEHNPNTCSPTCPSANDCVGAGGTESLAVATAVRAAVLAALDSNPGDCVSASEAGACAAVHTLALLAADKDQPTNQIKVTDAERRQRRLGNIERLLVDAKDNFWYAPGSTWKRQGISALVAAMDLVGLMAREEHAG